MSKPSKSKTLSLDSVLTFGKYKDSTVMEIIETNPGYLDWAISEQIIELDNTAFAKLRSELPKKRTHPEDEPISPYDWEDRAYGN